MAKLSVLEFAEKRLKQEEHEHELGADNRYDLHYWAAYIDGANAQLREDKSKLADSYWDACLDGRARMVEER